MHPSLANAIFFAIIVSSMVYVALSALDYIIPVL